MDKKFKYEGEWWLPENPERKINGELEYNGKEIILSLKDDIVQENKNDKAHTIGINYPHIPIILGKTNESEFEDGISFTLYNLSVRNSDSSKYDYSPQIVFKGMLFHKKEDIKFKKIIADFSHIGRFFGNFKPPKVLPSHEGVEITYKKPLPIEISINSMCKILIKKDFKLKSIPGEVPVLLQEGTTIETAFPEEKNLDNSLKFLWLFNSFLSFLIGSIVHPLEIKGYTEENPNNFVEIFYRVSPFLILETISLTSSYLILSKFGDFFRNWFEKADTLEPVYNLYSRILNTLHPFSATDFILLVEAIEVYHRRTYNDKHLPDDDYKKEVEKLFEGASSKIQFLKNRVGYSNELSLRERLKQIFEKQGEILKLFIKDTDRFTNCVVENRNYYVHYNGADKKEKKEILSEVKLYWLFIALKILLEVCLLKDLGKYEDEEIKNLLDRRYGRQIFNIEESIFQKNI